MKGLGADEGQLEYYLKERYGNKWKIYRVEYDMQNLEDLAREYCDRINKQGQEVFVFLEWLKRKG